MRRLHGEAVVGVDLDPETVHRHQIESFMRSSSTAMLTIIVAATGADDD